MVYERYSLWSYSGMKFARIRGVPSVLEVNAPLIEEQGRYRNLVNRATARDVACRVFRASDVLVAVSEGVATHLADFTETRGKVTVISNGVDPDRFKRVPAVARRAGRPLQIGFLGSLKPWHGVDVLLNAFAHFQRQHPDSRVVLVGDGPERARVERQTETLRMSKKVKLTGAVPAAQVPQLLADMDIAVAPYTDDRNFYFSPLKLFEYMAAGCAVLASRIGQVSQVINHGVDGLLCEPGDPNALAHGMTRLAHDTGLRHRLGSAARAKVIREYSWDHVVQRTLAAVQRSTVPQTRAEFG
jgi:glycosyltransferase involved in cell wall biosynthesis